MFEGVDNSRRQFLGVAAMAIAANCFGVAGCAKAQTLAEGSLSVEGDSPSFSGATSWLNTQPLMKADLRGKVVLVDFWTYSCINWRRTLPFIRRWAEKYKSHGLVVVGAHTPEFGFEKNVDNVRRAAEAMQIAYPIALDSDYKIWNAFSNEYWPALYFVDSHGRIRHHQFGEGDYDQSELVIQQLLTEAGAKGFDRGLVSGAADGVEAAPDWADLKSPETYVGYSRTENFASPGGSAPHKNHAYVFPARLKLNHWALLGDWTVDKQAAALNRANGQIAFSFHARDLHLVMGPSAAGATVRFRVLIDGEPPRDAHGVDTDNQGLGTVTEPRLYQLVRQSNSVSDRRFEIEFLDPGVEAFSFTFG